MPKVIYIMDPDSQNVMTCRVKQEREESPAPSCVPMKRDRSMERPEKFKRDSSGFSVQHERGESPAPSCVSMKSEQSMEPPHTFKRDGCTPELRTKNERVESSAASCLSLKNEESMEQSIHFKRECWTPELSEFSSSLLIEDHFRCSVCSEGLRDPVSISCGHSYCRQCISTYWAQPSLAGDYQCPQCSKSFPTRPELSTNTALVRVLQALQQTGFSPVLPAVAHTGPGDVACDICCGPKLRAVKTCVTCSASYCESHVRQHYTVPALQRHTLTQVTGDQRHTLTQVTGDQRHTRTQVTGDQRHTHQQDSVTKMETMEKEVTLKPKKRKVQFKEEGDADEGFPDKIFGLKKRIRKLEQEVSELKNICKDLQQKVPGLKNISDQNPSTAPLLSSELSDVTAETKDDNA